MPPSHIWLPQAPRTNHPGSRELWPPKQPQCLPQLAFPITLPGPTRLLRLQSWVRTELYRGTRLPPLPSQQKAQSFQHVVGWGIKAALHLAQPHNHESLGILQGCSMEELHAAGGKLRPSHRSSISSPAHTVPQLLPFAPIPPFRTDGHLGPEVCYVGRGWSPFCLRQGAVTTGLGC